MGLKIGDNVVTHVMQPALTGGRGPAVVPQSLLHDSAFPGRPLKWGPQEALLRDGDNDNAPQALARGIPRRLRRCGRMPKMLTMQPQVDPNYVSARGKRSLFGL
jgi:hypothetical protein